MAGARLIRRTGQSEAQVAFALSRQHAIAHTTSSADVAAHAALTTGVHGLGTMSQQDADSVAITGGSAQGLSLLSTDYARLTQQSGSTVDGYIWYDSTALQIGSFLAGLQGYFRRSLATSIADKTISNSSAETSLIGTLRSGDTLTLPANYPTVGKRLWVYAAGYYSTKTPPPGNITITISLGGTTLLTTGAHLLDASELNQFWRVAACFIFRSIGASGTIIGQSAWEHCAEAAATSDLLAAEMVSTAPIVVNTTNSLAFDITAQFSTADAANSITCTCFTLDEG